MNFEQNTVLLWILISTVCFIVCLEIGYLIYQFQKNSQNISRPQTQKTDLESTRILSQNLYSSALASTPSSTRRRSVLPQELEESSSTSRNDFFVINNLPQKISETPDISSADDYINDDMYGHDSREPNFEMYVF